jgi:hypothetical protein
MFVPTPPARFAGGLCLCLGLVFWAAPLFAQAAATNDPSMLAPPLGEMAPAFWERHAVGMLLAALALLALAGGLAWFVFQPPPVVVAPPAELARERLAKLLHQPENGDTLSEVSQALQHYFMAAFPFPPGGLTTTEFSAALAANETIGAELAAAVAGFLRECDHRKFAPAGPADPPLNAASQALELVAAAEQARAAAAGPERGRP